MIKRICDPMQYMGKLHKNNYFEGWYYKQVSAVSQRTVAFIPGISRNATDQHCFVQAILSPPVESHYFRYPIEQFHWSTRPFELTVGKSHFSKTGCTIRLSNESASMEGQLSYGQFTEIQKRWWMPTIMGYFAYIPNMECNHAVISMNHTVDGCIRYNGSDISFCNDFGYIEKDWGKSFPSRYVWVQANHFPRPGDSIMLSIASIPMLLFTFKGFIANFLCGGVEYRFATYNGAKLTRFEQKSDRLDVEIKKDKLLLQLCARVFSKGTLKAPVQGRMENVIKEGLGGTVTIRLYSNGGLLYQATSPHAGIEIE